MSVLELAQPARAPAAAVPAAAPTTSALAAAAAADAVSGGTGDTGDGPLDGRLVRSLLSEERPLAIGAREADKVDGLADEEDLFAQGRADEAGQHPCDEHIALVPELGQRHWSLLDEELAVRVVQFAVQHPPGSAVRVKVEGEGEVEGYGHG